MGKNKICSQGIWNSTIPSIKFNKNGKSNFCQLQQKLMDDYPRGERGLKDWHDLIDKIKLKGSGKRYDCIIGVSGGVDSSYLLFVAKEYGLRPLAVNLDNGFNSNIAVRNIFKITKKLNIDLETYVIDYEEIKDLLRSYMKASMPWIDAPTDLAIKAVMYKYALEEDIKYIIRGNDFRSEGKQPKEWTYCDSKQLKCIHRRFGNGIKLKTYPKLSLIKMTYAGLIKNILDVRPFYYIDYKKQNAKKMLIQKFGWKDYGGHHHENLFTKFAMAYWLPKKFGIDKRIINLSAQVLSGAITREGALDQLNLPFDTEDNLGKLKQYVIKKLELTEDEFVNIWNSENRNTFDYPSNYDLIYKNARWIKPLIAKIFSFKPMSVTANEFIK